MRTLLLFGAIAFSFGLSAQCTVTITPSSDIIICNGASVTLEASGGNGTWAWSPATGLNSTTGNTVTASPTTTTTYSVTSTCPNSTDATSTVTIEVLDLNVTAGPDILVCSENPINLISTVSGNGSNAVDYSWIGPNGYNSTSSSPTISNSTTAMSGDYTVTATVGGCQTQDVVNVIVADVQIASNQFVGNQLVYCLAQGETSGEIFFSLTIPSYSSSISNFSIDWDNNGTYDATYTNSTWSNPIIQNFPIGSSQFTIQMVLSNSCSVIQQYSVFVGSSPSPATLALFPNQANGCAPHTTEWNLTIPTLNVDGTTYTFNWGDGTSIL
jgi:hypothetical protein